MRLNATTLRRLIKEETRRVLREMEEPELTEDDLIELCKDNIRNAINDPERQKEDVSAAINEFEEEIETLLIGQAKARVRLLRADMIRFAADAEEDLIGRLADRDDVERGRYDYDTDTSGDPYAHRSRW